MSDGPLTVKILQEIREELRASREELHASRDEQRAFHAEANTRFEILETTLRDLAEQMVMLGRAVKVAIDSRGGSDSRVDQLEHRVAALEAKAS